MRDTDTPQRFAIGANEHNGCPCPAAAAGFDLDENRKLREVAAQYDMEGGYLSCPAATVDERTARQLWFDALEAIRDKYGEDYYLKGRDVSRRLGWD